jgi:hypothetical protein
MPLMDAKVGSTERKTPAFWDNARQAYYDNSIEALHEYRRYAKWFAGDMSDVTDSIRDVHGLNGVVESNMTNLAARMSRAELLFRNPRFQVRPPNTFGETVFTSELAKIESILLNGYIEETDFYNVGRQVILDMLLGPHGVFKVGLRSEIGENKEVVKAQRLMAQDEDQKMLVGLKPQVSISKDVHGIHLDQHEEALAAIERGDIPAPTEVIEQMMAHIEKHKKAFKKYGARSTEVLRNQHIVIARISPLAFFYDPWADSRYDRKWVGMSFIRPRWECEQDPSYNKEARSTLNTFQFTNIEDMAGDQDRYERLSEYSDHCLLYEIIDLEAGMVYTYNQGSHMMLKAVPYELADVLPSGPYIDDSFNVDSITNIGIPPPKMYEGHQVTLSLLESVSATTAVRTVPKVAAVKDSFTAEELEKLRNGTPAALIVLKRLAAGQKIQDVLQQIPGPAIDPQTVAIADRQVRAIERYSGLGSAKMAGGDFSKTATASAVVNESTGTLSEDMASLLDNLFARVGKASLRLMRRYYTPAMVAQRVGEEAIMHWPEVWADRDIVNDRGVSVVPGSARRKNSAVEARMHIDAYGLVAQNPFLPPEVHVELLQRIFDSLGLYGIDFTGMETALKLQKQQALIQALMGQQQQQQQQQGGGGGPPGSEGTASGQQQSANNPAGGRVPTGAGAGDKPENRGNNGSPRQGK